MAFFGSGILKGLRITLRNMLKRQPITLMYPHERNVLPERARWAVQMKRDDAGNHRCTACQICQNICPDGIIDIDITRLEDRSKHINRWNYELGACMMCGLCVEACPYDAIEMSHSYELATLDPDDLVYPLLQDTPAVPIPRKTPAAKPESSTAKESDEDA